ncbi:hypothetical protein D823_00725 [Streptococcus sobrinus DSM 20742 = ATCC 33478]|nr:hypothetical protein D823_00725 [Streptococcus sobrinus DSM 20742 = ATCC 33478]
MAKEDVIEIEGKVVETMLMLCLQLSLKMVTKFWRQFQGKSARITFVFWLETV